MRARASAQIALLGARGPIRRASTLVGSTIRRYFAMDLRQRLRDVLGREEIRVRALRLLAGPWLGAVDEICVPLPAGFVSLYFYFLG